MKSNHLAAIGLLTVGLLGSSVFGDVLHLRDGSKLEGSLKHTDDGWLVQTDAAIAVHVLSAQVESIELTTSAATTPKAAMERLVSLRHSVEGLSDLAEIISRYKRFVDQDSDTVSAAEAKKDAAIWQDRLKQKMVKVGPAWLTAEERAKLVEQAGQTAETARQLMKQGRSKEADPLLAEVLAVDPLNATALYLTGLLQFQQEQIPAARKTFEATSGIIPNHAPTLNNLAIVLWRQRQFVPGLNDFDQAMLSSPVDKIILDNVAVALQTLPVELQKSPAALKVVRHFNEQDQQLAEIMAHQGMRRYGSLWVSEKDIDRMKQEEKQTQEKLDQLAGDFDRSRQRIDQLAQTVSDNDTQIHRIESSSYAIDPRTGIQTPVAYPSAYYDLVRDNQNAQRARDSEVTKLDQMKKQAVDLQHNRAGDKNTGVMRMVGPEGTPIRIPPQAVMHHQFIYQPLWSYSLIFVRAESNALPNRGDL